MDMNLLEETLITLREYGKSLDDIKWFGQLDGYMPLEHIKEILDVDYDDGFGCVEISQTLVICGEDWWLERNEYDGSEWWEYKEKPTKPKQQATNFNIKTG